MKKWIITLFLLFISTLAVHAEPVEVQLSIPDNFLCVQEFGEAYVDVSLTNSGEPATYRLEYSWDNFETVYDYQKQITVGRNQTETVRISAAFPKGRYLFQVRAISGEDCFIGEIDMAVMEIYERQFMDEYTKIGVNLNLPVSNRLKVTYLDNKKFMENDIKLCQMMGATLVRPVGAVAWRWLETDDGVFDPSQAGVLWDQYNETLGASSLCIDPYRPSHGEGGHHGRTSRTPEQIKHNAEYVQRRIELAEEMGNVRFYAEFANEPDLPQYFWPDGDLYGIQCMDLLRYMYFALYDVTDKFSFSGGSVSGGGDAVKFLEYMYAQDAYKYTDAVAYHPYIKTQTVDQRFDSVATPYEQTVENLGGWLQKYITEIGWESGDVATSALRSHAEKAQDIAKLFLKTYLHDIDLTWYYSTSSVVYGIQKGTFDIATHGTIAYANLAKWLNSAQYVGMYPMEAEGIQCALFIKDRKPFIGVWMPTGKEKATFQFRSPVVVEDIYGNQLYTDTEVEIGDEVLFISGFDMDYVYETVYAVKNAMYDQIAVEYAEKIDPSIFDAVKAISAEEIAADPYRILQAHYDVGDALLEAFADGKTSLEVFEISEILSDLNVAGEKIANAYGATVKERSDKISEKYMDVRSEVNALKGEEKHATVLYSDKILKYSQRYYEKAKDAESRDYAVMRAPLIAVNSFLSERTAIWAQKLIPFQTVDDTIGILTMVDPYGTSFYQSTDGIEVNYRVDNKRISGIDGEVIVVNGDEKVLTEPIPVKLSPGEYKEIPLYIPNDRSLKLEDMYKIRLLENGKMINEKWFPVTRQEVLKVELLETNVNFDDLTKISVCLTNNTPDIIDGTVTISMPDGWEMENATLEYHLEGFAEEIVDFRIAEKKKIAFNTYCFGILVKDAKGTEYFNKKLPLSFPIIVKADKEMDVQNFNGDIYDWANAYPVYAGTAEDPEDIESWRNTDVTAIAFFKYDADYLYILTNVYDNIFYGRYPGTSMWHSDSMQMLVDPLNNGGTTPQSDDYGFFMGYTMDGYEVISNEGPNGASNDNVFKYDNALMAIRDDELHVTRYLMKLPWSAIAPLQPNYGTKFRLNMCFNDADIEERHTGTEFTYGIYIGGKNRTPGNFYEFMFVGSEKKADTPLENTILDVTMDNDTVQLK